MQIAHLVLVILGLLCFTGAACEMKFSRIDLVAAGLFFWLLSTLVVVH